MTEIYRSPWFNLEGYLACTVKYSNGSKRTVLQHREVMEVFLKRRLDRFEFVHHKDENKRNNDILNLEVLSPQDHRREHAKGVEMVNLRCLLCGSEFNRIARYERSNRKSGKVGPFCGRSCAGKWSTGAMSELVDEPDLESGTARCEGSTPSGATSDSPR